MRSCFRPFTIVLAMAAGLGGLRSPVCAQELRNGPTGAPHDWTHHHVVFSNPGTAAQAIEKGTYGEWLAIANGPRFQMQKMKREAAARANLNLEQLLGPSERRDLADTPNPATESESEERIPVGKDRDGEQFGLGRRRRRPGNHVHKDWRTSMGSSSTAVRSTYPAKYSFSLAAANCGNARSPDFVAIHTGVQGEALPRPA
jgi:hypothetical protein